MRLSGTVIQLKNVPGGADYGPYQKAFILDVESNPPKIRSCRVGDTFGPVGLGQEVDAVVNVGVYEGHDTCTLLENITVTAPRKAD